MSETNKNNYSFLPSFYDKYLQDDENMQAKIKPILNQVQENRVAIKELHTEYGIKFSEMIISYKNRLEELKYQYDNQISKLQSQQNTILNKCNELLEDLKRQNPKNNE